MRKCTTLVLVAVLVVSSLFIKSVGGGNYQEFGAGSQILSFSLTNKVLAGMGYDDIESRYRVLCLSR